MFDVGENILRLKNALSAGDSAAATSAAQELDLGLVCMETITEETYSRLMELLSAEDLYRFDSPELIVGLFTDNLDRLGEQQRVRLAKSLEEVYARCNSEAACMLMVEMLTELVDASQFIEFSERAARTADIPRAIAAYGLGYFLKKAKPSERAEPAALELLRTLAQDPDEDVRNEAERVLLRLQTPKK